MQRCDVREVLLSGDVEFAHHVSHDFVRVHRVEATITASIEAATTYVNKFLNKETRRNEYL